MITAVVRAPAVFPDRLDAVIAAARAAGARPDVHNLGGVHAAAHHAALSGGRYQPARLPAETWSAILAENRLRG